MNGQIDIKLQSKYINAFCVELESKHKEDYKPSLSTGIYGCYPAMNNLCFEVDKVNMFTMEQLELTINNLDVNIKYRVRVKANNIFGESSWSEWSKYITGSDKERMNE